MIRNLRRRLEFIESKIPRQPTEQEKLHAWLSQFMVYAIAFYLGEPKPEESIMDAYMRALGYGHSFEYLKACKAENSDLIERVRVARAKVFAKFGIDDMSTCDSRAFADAAKRIKAGFSDLYKADFRDVEAEFA